MLQRALNHQVVYSVCLIPLLSCSNTFHMSSGPQVWTQFLIHGLDPSKLCTEIHTDCVVTELGFLGPFVTEIQSSHHACVKWLGQEHLSESFKGRTSKSWLTGFIEEVSIISLLHGLWQTKMGYRGHENGWNTSSSSGLVRSRSQD